MKDTELVCTWSLRQRVNILKWPGAMRPTTGRTGFTLKRAKLRQVLVSLFRHAFSNMSVWFASHWRSCYSYRQSLLFWLSDYVTRNPRSSSLVIQRDIYIQQIGCKLKFGLALLSIFFFFCAVRKRKPLFLFFLDDSCGVSSECII